MSVAATAVQLPHPQQNPPPPFHLRLHDPFETAPPPQPYYRASSCDRHPDQPVTGFCAERLEGLDAATRRAEKAKGGSGAAGVLRSVFFHHSGNHQNPSSSAASFLPEIRRCKSFSGSSVLPPPASALEPQRRSCDVRGRSTLWTLFHLDDKQEPPSYIGSVEADRRNLGGGRIRGDYRSDCLEEIPSLQLQRFHSVRLKGQPHLPRGQLRSREQVRGHPHGRGRRGASREAVSGAPAPACVPNREIPCFI